MATMEDWEGEIQTQVVTEKKTKKTKKSRKRADDGGVVETTITETTTTSGGKENANTDANEVQDGSVSGDVKSITSK